MAVATTPRTTNNGRVTYRPEVKIETVTGRTAKKYLEENQTNRRLRPHRVQVYVGILERGEWRLTGDAIAFDTQGFLLNGQHRLAAIAESGISAELVVLRNLPAETQDVMDRGLQRSLADSLKLRGHVNVFVLASALNWIYRLDYIEATGNVHYALPEERPTTNQALAMLKRQPDLPEYVRMTAQVRHTLKLRHGATAALWARFAKLDEEGAAEFFEQLETGLEFKLGKQDPIYYLRRALVTDMTAIARMPDYRQVAMIAKGWNQWREGKAVQQLAWKYGGTQREAFPIPR